MGLSLSPLRRRHLLLALLLIFLPCIVFILISSPGRFSENVRTPSGRVIDLSGEAALVERLAELQLRLQHLDALYRAREEDVTLLSQHLGSLLQGEATNLTETRGFLLNTTGLLKPPSAYHFLPHLLLGPTSLRPAYCLSKGRTGVSVILGVPTVRREVQSYLLSTLQNIIASMSPEEEQDTIIVVLIAETDEEYVLQLANDIKENFEPEVNKGLVEVIAPPASYYPDMKRLRLTLGDSAERVRWRTKQNLDFAFLMMYAQPKAMFYVQLEDDILAKPHFITTMKSVALERIATKKPWFLLDFCQLGFIVDDILKKPGLQSTVWLRFPNAKGSSSRNILQPSPEPCRYLQYEVSDVGNTQLPAYQRKMFRCVDLPWLIQFFFMFYNDKPGDWLLDHLINTKICSLDADWKRCKKAKEELWIHYKPSLFQHIGTHSSLKGKVQKLKDKQFGRVRLFFPHTNPDAIVLSEIKSYKQYTLKRAYQGESFFWGLLPQPGDHLYFKFTSPLLINKYMLRSGNAEHPLDRFYNTSVEVMPLLPPNSFAVEAFNYTKDGFVLIGKFDSMGVAEGKVDPRLGAVKEMRLTVHSESDKWAILSEILIDGKKQEVTR